MFISLFPALTLPHTNLGENLNFTFLLLLQTSQEPRSSECCSPCSQLPLDGTKAHGKASGLQGGAGAEGEHQLRCWHPAPMDRHLRPPSSTRGHQGETSASGSGRAIQAVSVSSSPGLNPCRISVEFIHKTSLQSWQWDFSPVREFPFFFTLLSVLH